MDTNITHRRTKFRRLGHLASAILSPFEPLRCPKKTNTEMGVSVEDIFEHQRVFEGMDK